MIFVRIPVKCVHNYFQTSFERHDVQSPAFCVIALRVVHKKIYNRNGIADTYIQVCLHGAWEPKSEFLKGKKKKSTIIYQTMTTIHIVSEAKRLLYSWNAQYVPTIRGRSTRVTNRDATEGKECSIPPPSTFLKKKIILSILFVLSHQFHTIPLVHLNIRQNC